MLSGLIGLDNFGDASRGPRTSDPELKIEIVAQGLEQPTSMAFLGSDDILVLEKDNGKVRRIVNNTLLPEPLIDLKVANAWERGLLGIVVSESVINNSDGYETRYEDIHPNSQEYSGSTVNVFLYFTKVDSAETETDSVDVNLCLRPNLCQYNGLVDGNNVTNYMYRYEFKDNRLINPKLLLKIPATPGADHNGGTLAIGPDNNVYVIASDGDSCIASTCYKNFEQSVLNSMRSNFENG